MKQTTKYLLSVLTLALVFVGCKRTEDDLFSENPTVRLNKYTNQTREQLIGAANGWEVLYFMEPSTAGYAILMKFNADGTVKMAAKNPITTHSNYVTDESLWSLIQEDGAIISFPTWNSVIHAFSDPGSDGVGHGGDYEFVVKEHSDKYMRVTGRKHGAQIYMYPLAEDQDWEDYFAQIDANNDRMFTGNNEILFNLVRNGEKQQVRFEDNYFGWSVGDTANYIYGFITTPRGISFYYQDGIEVGDKRAQDFVFNAENTRLYCVNDGIDAYFEAYYTISEFFEFKLKDNKLWYVDAGDMGSDAASVYNDFCDNIAASPATSDGKRYKITDFSIKRLGDDKLALLINYRVGNEVRQGVVTITYAVNGETLTLTYESHDGNANAMLMRSSNADLEAGVAKFKAIFEGTFNLTSARGGTLNAANIRMTDVNNPNRNIKIYLK